MPCGLRTNATTKTRRSNSHFFVPSWFASHRIEEDSYDEVRSRARDGSFDHAPRLSEWRQRRRRRRDDRAGGRRTPPRSFSSPRPAARGGRKLPARADRDARQPQRIDGRRARDARRQIVRRRRAAQRVVRSHRRRRRDERPGGRLLLPEEDGPGREDPDPRQPRRFRRPRPARRVQRQRPAADRQGRDLLHRAAGDLHA